MDATYESVPEERLREEVPCQWACPAHTRVPEYIDAIRRGDFPLALRLNQEDNLLPGVLGRICTRPCEDACRHGREGLGAPVAICRLKRVAADHAEAIPAFPPVAATSGRRIAVVGAGPAGLATAHHLAAAGHEVHLFEGEARAGGLVTHGIPPFRLPAEVRDRDLAALVTGRLRIRTGVVVGRDVALQTLVEEHDAVVVATGCAVSRRLGVPGEELPGCYEGLAFLRAANAGCAPCLGDRVLVVGGGFTAVDCARMARRLGAHDVTMVVRRTRADLAVRPEDLAETLAEGIGLEERRLPLAVLGADAVRGLRLARTRVERDPATGVRRAIADDEAVERPAETVIVAIGQVPEPLAALGLPGLAESPTDPIRTTHARVFLAGDRALGPHDVVTAVAHGARVAEAVDAQLAARSPRPRRLRLAPAAPSGRPAEWDALPRTPTPLLTPEARLSDACAEVETAMARDDAVREASRCYLCHLVFRIEEAGCVYCDRCVEVCPQDCIPRWRERPAGLARLAFWRGGKERIRIESSDCVRCGACVTACPTACIRVDRLTLTDAAGAAERSPSAPEPPAT